MNFDSVIFDVDGTLWDAVDPTAEGFSLASEGFEFGPKHFSRETVLRELGKPLQVIFEDLYPEIKKTYKDENKLREIFHDLGERSVREEYAVIRRKGALAYPFLTETLAELKKHVPLYIVSNCEKGYIELFMEMTGTRDMFSGWLCFGDTGKEKDHTIKALADSFGLKAPCYVGDIENDAICAGKAGVPFIWASYGFGYVSKDLYYGKLNEFRDIKNFIIG